VCVYVCVCVCVCVGVCVSVSIAQSSIDRIGTISRVSHNQTMVSE